MHAEGGGRSGHKPDLQDPVQASVLCVLFARKTGARVSAEERRSCGANGEEEVRARLCAGV